MANQLAWENVVGGDEFNSMTDGFVGAAEAQNLTVRPAHPFGEAFRIHFGTDTVADGNWVTFRQDVNVDPKDLTVFGYKDLFYLQAN